MNCQLTLELMLECTPGVTLSGVYHGFFLTAKLTALSSINRTLFSRTILQHLMRSGKIESHFWFIKTESRFIRFWGIKLEEFQAGTWLSKKNLIAVKF